MLFNSIDFAVFLPVVFILYWFVTNDSLKLQNFLTVIASYVFYGWWDPRFLALIFFSTLVDFLVGAGLSKAVNPVKRKALLLASVIINLGFLGFFKYYNFFLDQFISAFSFFGTAVKASFLNVILPVGISFYTFQTLSYSIDVYRRKLEPAKDFIAFAAFVSFFPQLVAGPIERATHLLPQFYHERRFDHTKAVDGMRQILWGLFKKVVIADNCAEYANLIFDNASNYSGTTLILGALFFAFQIYGDFSGYSDIAIGTSRLFGFDLMRNFNFPYFSRDPAEFWRRWHISLTTWFRDYLYIPLGGSRGSARVKIRNTFLVFIVSGFWHGANWTFIAWGTLNALYFLPFLLTNTNRRHTDVAAKGRKLPAFKEFFQILFTFALITFSWIFFRAGNIHAAFRYIYRMAGGLLHPSGYVQTIDLIHEIGYTLPILLTLFIVIEWSGREEQFALVRLGAGWIRPVRWAMYYAIVFSIFWLGGEGQQFIYFQF